MFLFEGFGSSIDGNISVAVCSNPKMEYEIISHSASSTEHNIEWLDKDRVDYNFVLK